MICLDTNAVIAVLNDRASPVRTRIDAAVALGHPLAISSIVLFELRYGAAKSARPERNTQRIADFLSGPIEVLPFEPTDADEAGDTRSASTLASAALATFRLGLRSFCASTQNSAGTDEQWEYRG